MSKKEKHSKTEDAALQNESVETKADDFKISSFDDDNRKSGVYIDKAEAEAFLEAQRKKKLRNKIITTVVVVAVVALVIFIVYNVVFGGNSGFIKFPSYALTNAEAMPVGTAIDNNTSNTLFGEAVNKDGLKTELWYSPADSLLSVVVRGENGEILDTFRSWPAPRTAADTDPSTLDSEFPKYAKPEDHKIISSLVNVVYSTSNLDGGKSFSINSIEHTEEIYSIANGFRIKFTVSDAGCSFVVEFYLDSNGELVVNVPKSELSEPEFEAAFAKNDDDTDKMPRLASVTCLPFFGATMQGDEGYFVVPDGAGAVTYFDEPRISNYSEYSKRIYGVDETFDSTGTTKPNISAEYVMVPVYGIVGKNTMVTCLAEEGESAASVVIGMPGVKNLKFYYINYSFKWREYYYSSLGGGGSYKFLEIPASGGDFTQRYAFAVNGEGEKFTYVDVAEQARDFLLTKWNKDSSVYTYLKDNVNKLGDESDSAELMYIKLFLAAVNESSVSLLSEVKVMTTFAQSKQIIADLKNAGAMNVKYSLLGWQNDGYFGNVTKRFSIEKDLGGKSELKDINKWASDENIELSADQNMLLIYGKPAGGASLRSAVVKTPGYEYLKYKIISNAGTFVKDTEFYYMSPLFYDKEMLEEDIEGLGKLGFTNVDLQQMGSLLYTDYNRENALLRQQAIEYYKKWIAAYKEAFGEVSVYYGFDYAASVADNILDLTFDSSNLFQLDQTVPFVQIIYHGLIDCYSEPINRSSNNIDTTLKAIEYGTFPAYEVTWNLTEELKYTKYNSLFKSSFTDLRNQILEGYALSQKSLAKVEDATITDHYCVDGEKSGNVYCTEYSNGVKIYVNYGDNAYVAEEGSVPASGVGVVSADGYESIELSC